MFSNTVCVGGLLLLAAHTSAQTVSLDYVTLNGRTDKDSGLASFLGIPYADPPTGDLRFRAPVFPPSTDLGERNATKLGKACISSTNNPGSASENCLVLNVFTPANSTSDSKLPVMVWFHGGGFTSGDSHDDPTVLMQSSKDPLIFVSVDYRLGPFGFLGGEAVKSDGDINAGLLDQRAALQWVNKYINEFGGDSSRVTIWGQSAGAATTIYHLLAYGGDNSGLFHQAIADSVPFIFTPSYNDDYIEALFTDFVDAADCAGDDPLSCLRSADAKKLAKAGQSVVDSHPATLFAFTPILDGESIRSQPVQAFSDGEFAKVPVMTGYNSDEGSGWSAGLPASTKANTASSRANADTVYNFLKGQFDSYPKESFDNDALPLYPLEDYGGSVDRQGQQMYGEVRYICSAPLVNGAVVQSGQKAWQYHFNNPASGSTHGAEMTAFFRDDADPEKRLFKAMREYWTSFVTGGEPIAENYTEWDSVSDDSARNSIRLEKDDTEMEDMGDDQKARCEYWRGIGDQVYTRPSDNSASAILHTDPRYATVVLLLTFAYTYLA